MASVDLRHCQFARAFLGWAVMTRLDGLTWAEYQTLLHAVYARERRIEGCGHKEAFLTFAAATKITKRRRGHNGSKHRHAYRCDLCGAFHITDNDYNRTRRLLLRERLRA